MACLLRFNMMDRTPLFERAMNVGEVRSRKGPDRKALSAPVAPRHQLRCAKACSASGRDLGARFAGATRAGDFSA